MTILLISVALLFMVIAIAAIAIDVGAMYSARGEAKHAADAAALAGAEILANSGMTSDPTNLLLQGAATTLASQIATTVATQNKVGGRNLTSGEVTVSFPNSGKPDFVSDPQVSVAIQRLDLPTFFAKAWGRSIVAVGATSVAEAVNPSNAQSASGNPSPVVVAPRCVKPWILSNKNPIFGGKLFNPANGAIMSPNMVGQKMTVSPACGPTGCTFPLPAIGANQFYFGASTTPPANQEPASCTLNCDYEEDIAACSPQPVVCGVSPNATVDLSKSCFSYNASTHSATSCLIHSPGQDSITLGGGPPLTQPARFVAGNNNPLFSAGSQISVSDSIVTIPVYDDTVAIPSSGNVDVIGFIQAFIESTTGSGKIKFVIVNMSGCGTGATGSPIIGNGMSSVPVHLISP